MKKLNLFLWFVALLGLMTACDNEENVLTQDSPTKRIRIGASIEHAATRAETGKVTMPGADYQLRYIIEVRDIAFNAVYREEVVKTDATGVDFSFELNPGTYKAYLWADFIDKSATTEAKTTPNSYTHYADKHYVTTNVTYGLKEITLRDEELNNNYVVNDESRDAFFKCVDIAKTFEAFDAGTVTMTRPFGQINVIEKNSAVFANLQSMTLNYQVPRSFNLETGIPSTDFVTASPTVTTFPTPTTDRKANLFYDFIFAPSDKSTQTTLGQIEMTFISKDATAVPAFTIPANMPVVQNKRTNISGNIVGIEINNEVKLSVKVDDTWDTPSIEKELLSPPNVDEAKQWLGLPETGTTNFTITEARQLYALAYLIDNYARIDGAATTTYYSEATYKLGNDIDLLGKEFTPIGKSTYFKGTFDGQGYSVTGLNVVNHRGFFEKVDGGVIKHLLVKGKIINNTDDLVGGIVGFATTSATIAFCGFEGELLCNRGSGIAGQIQETSKIISCFSNVKTEMVYGGIIDTVNSSDVEGCTWFYNANAVAGERGTKDAYASWNTNDGKQNASFSDAATLATRVDVMNSYNTDYNYKWAIDGETLKLVAK